MTSAKYQLLDDKPKISLKPTQTDLGTTGSDLDSSFKGVPEIPNTTTTDIDASFIESSSHHQSRHWTLTRSNGWFGTAFLMLTDVIGTGVLGLPRAFKLLGWIPGILAMVFFCFLGQYTGKLLCKLVCAYPESGTVGMLAENLYNKTGAVACYLFLYLFLFFVAGEYLLVSGKAVQGMFYSNPICIETAIFYVICVLTPLTQVRTLHSVALLSIISIVTILIVLVMCSFYLIKGGVVEGSRTELIACNSFWDVFSGFSSIVFAYAGHTIYIEMMYEMHTPGDFAKTINLAYPFMLFVYMSTACIGYYWEGNLAKGYLVDSIPIGINKAIASAFMFVHINISYVLNSQVLSRAIHRRISSETVNAFGWDTKRRRSGCLKGQAIWFIITSSLTGAAFVAANSISFFESFVDLLGSLFGPWFMFGAPSTMYIIFTRRNGRFTKDIKAMTLFCIFCCATLMSLGTISTVIGMINLWDTFAHPWSCLRDT